MNPDQIPLLLFIFVGLVFVVIICMSSGSWAWFGAALAVHLIASSIVLTGAFRSARTGNESDEKSERLTRAGKEAAGNKRATLEDELEALKREPARRI